METSQTENEPPRACISEMAQILFQPPQFVIHLEISNMFVVIEIDHIHRSYILNLYTQTELESLYEIEVIVPYYCVYGVGFF